MDLDTSKNLGGIGALLLVISGVGIFGTAYVGVLGLIGIILVLIALKGTSDYYKEAGIFNNALYSIIIAIIGGVAFVGSIIASILYFVSSLPSWAQTYIDNGDWNGLAAAFQNHLTDLGNIWTLLGAVILALVVLFIFAIVAMIYFRKSLGLLSAKSGVGLFGTTGLIMLIGAVLTIIVIGFLLIWIGWILLTIAFFSVKTPTATQAMPPPPP
jgi:uncharacterized membrane protein